MYVSSGMDQQQLNNRDSITKQHFMDTMIRYLSNLPFDAERFAIIVQRYIQDEEINLYLETILHDYDSGDDVDEVEAR
jgi:nicotinamide mononucleotide adenylyltransferase